ncbi:MAG TPA: hypothetical protein VMV49_10770 [Candidatus Deferrimicrobium sp.]|nr:hypothetical protein [Candidatus Deferrimicrobium sp.]
MDYNIQVVLTSYTLFSVFVICTILLIWKWKTKNVQPFLYAALSWGAFAMQNFLLGTVYLINYFMYYINWPLYSTVYIFTVIAILSFLVFIDNVTRESINVIKISIVSAIGALLIYTTIFRSYILPTIPFAAFYDLLMDFYLIFLFLFLVRSTLKAPKNLKKLSLFLTIITVSLGCLSYIFSWIFYGLGFFLSGFYAAIMNLILVYVLVKNPELLYILPYRVHRLTVIHSKIGISIYDHQFEKSEIDGDLLAGLLSALQQMSIEVLHIGELEEMKLSQGILIFIKANYTTVGLITSKSSKHLRDSLKKFIIEFENRFNNLLIQDVLELNQFKSAIDLIDFFFGNIPSYQ